MERIAHYFLPRELRQADTIERRRAALVVKMALVLFPWGVAAAVSIYVTQGDWTMSAAMALVPLALMGVPPVLRQTGSLQLASLLLLIPLYAVVTWYCLETGGLLAPALSGLVLVPLMALICLSRTWALAWMALVMATWAAMFVAGPQGLGGEFAAYEEQFRLRRFSELMIVGGAVFAMFYVKDSLKQWLVDKSRQARDEALEASRAKSAFLANMSHELRTPLNAVIGYSEMLIEDAEHIVEDEQEEGSDSVVRRFVPDLQRIRTAGRHLLALITDILDISKIEAGKIELRIETFDPRGLCNDVAETAKSLAMDNNNDFQVELADDLGEMTSDATKIRQILFNLVSNACKFTSDGEVRLSVRRLEGDEVEFVVQDTGIGMEAGEIEAVFGAFEQADTSTTRRFGGTGLGLTITSHFCTLLGGTIDVDSTRGEGTTMTVRLPARVEEHQGDDG